MPKTKRVTLKLIAQRAGTSIGTVDRALKDRDGVRESTKVRVLAVARELGYSPNPFTNALRRMGSIRLALVYPEQPERFYAPIVAGINDAVNDLSDFGVEVVHVRYPLHKQTLQEEVLERLAIEDFQGVAINSAGPRIAAQINRIAQAGVPVITFNTDTANSMRRYFVGNDSLQSGRMGAALLGRYLGGTGAVTVLGNFVQAMPFSERFGGFCETIHDAFPDMTLYPCAECLADEHLASSSLIDLLTNVPHVRGVFCTGYTSTVGAISALKQLNRPDIVLIGYDTSDELLTALREGWCDALLYQDPYQQGYAAVQTLAQYVLDSKMPDARKINILTHIVIKQNADSYR
ncbi:MAG: substrate-binding domain-containing protein [Eubacteriales bacterium]|nr:substrate-binding domain-containing protein [Eubacteriales bacterium]